MHIPNIFATSERPAWFAPAGIAAALIATLGLAVFASQPVTSPPAQQQADDQTPAAAADPANIMGDAAFLAKYPSYPSDIAALIRTAGYECPAATNLWNRGESPYGLKVEAICGPDSSSANTALHYAVYPQRTFVHVCEPFRMFGADCS